MLTEIIRKDTGFTLLEVLVATAVTGIALGVLMSTIAQGHRQSFRGDMERKAGIIAETVMQHALSGDDISTGSGEAEGYPGWSYSVELREPEVRVTDDSDNPVEIELEGLAELVVTITPPGNARHFTVSRLVESRGM
jgi:prepilin-type N-terminal cleavage/methylation domain-containing protein